MRKLVLELEALQVETFNTDATGSEVKGTVRGLDASDSACCIYPGDFTFDCSLANCSGNCGLPSQVTCEGPGCYTHQAEETV